MSIRPINTGEEFYENIFNWPLTVLFILFDLAIAAMFFLDGLNIALLLLSFIAAFIYMNFYCMQIAVERGEVFISFGIGLFRSAVSQGEISHYMVEPSKSLYSWFFNPFSENVAVIYFRDGSRKTIPSNNARKLIDRLRSR